MSTLLGVEVRGDEVFYRLSCRHDYGLLPYYGTPEESAARSQERIGTKERCDNCKYRSVMDTPPTREEYSVDGINWTCDDGDGPGGFGPFDPKMYTFRRVRDIQQNRVLRFDNLQEERQESTSTGDAQKLLDRWGEKQ